MSPVDAANPNLVLPAALPTPIDDGAADHLPGRRLPSLRLPSTDGDDICLRDLDHGRILVYVFPMTGLLVRTCQMDGTPSPVRADAVLTTATCATITQNWSSTA